MPRSRSFHIEAVAELFSQLRYAPVETRRRQMDAAEGLVSDVDPTLKYPASFLIYRVTGYRPSLKDDPVIVGDALRSDLGTFIQRLSRSIELTAEDAGRVPLSLDDVAEELGVSRKSVNRYRERGLVCHEIQDDGGTARLVCFEDALQRFRDREGDRLARAGAFSRMSADETESIVARARDLRTTRGWSVQRIAQRLATEFKRSPETIRQLLHRVSEDSDDRVFDTRARMPDRAATIVTRAYRMGVPTSRLAERFGRSRKTIHRLIMRSRAANVRSIELEWIELPTFELPDAGEVLLAPTIVRVDLDEPAIPEDGIAMVEVLREVPQFAADDEAALVAAYNHLKRRAAHRRAALPRDPGAQELDDVETDLRWAALLNRKLATRAVAPFVRAAEQHAGRAMTSWPADVIGRVFVQAAQVVAATIDTLDPSRDQRLERLIAQAMDRSLARQPISGLEGRAAARHARGVIGSSSFVDGLCHWAAALSPPWSWRRFLDDLEPGERTVLCRAFGWDGRAPMTMQAVAAIEKRSVSAVSRELRSARSALLAAVASARPET